MDILNKKPLQVHFQTQNPNEKVYLILRRAVITNASWILTGIALLIFSQFLFQEGEIILGKSFWREVAPTSKIVLEFTWYLGVFGYLLTNFTKWYYHVILITDSRVLDIDLVGLLYRNVAEAQLGQIQDVSHSQGGIWQLTFNYGDVFVQTAATKQNIELTSVPSPGEVHDVITDLAAKKNQGKNIT